MSSSAASARELAPEFLSVVARINRLATQRVRMPVPYAQARLLSVIEDQGRARISDLAAIDNCAQPTMTTQVQRLEDAALVARASDPADARAVLISITDEGIAALARVRADRAAIIDPYLERLDEHDRHTLAEATRIMREILDDARRH